MRVPQIGIDIKVHVTVYSRDGEVRIPSDALRCFPAAMAGSVSDVSMAYDRMAATGSLH